MVSQVRTFRGMLLYDTGRQTVLELRTGRVVLGLSFPLQDAMLPALQASRKSKHFPPAVVVLGRYTCDTGRVTLWGRGECASAGLP